MADSETMENPSTENPTSASSSPNIASTAKPTTIIPFDGKGADPATLIGREVQWYYNNDQPSRLELKTSNGRVQVHREGVTEDWKQDEDEDEDEICIDGNLETALDALRGKRDKTLKILEAVVGERESDVCGLWDVKFWKLKHRVVGLRLEGMEELGYVACMTECDGECEDEGDVENYELFFHDVVLAPRWIKYKRY